MQINSMKPISFGCEKCTQELEGNDAFVIKSRKSGALYALEMSKNSYGNDFAYKHLTFPGPDTDGYFRGVVMKNKAKNTFNKLEKIFTNLFKENACNQVILATCKASSEFTRVLSEQSKTFIVDSVEDLKNLPILRHAKIKL